MRSFAPYILLLIVVISSCTGRGGSEVLCLPPPPQRFDFQVLDANNNNLFDPGNPQHPGNVTFVNTCTDSVTATTPMHDSIGHYLRVNGLNYSGPPTGFTCHKYLVKYSTGLTDTLEFETEIPSPDNPCSPTIMKDVRLNGTAGEKFPGLVRTYFVFRK